MANFVSYANMEALMTAIGSKFSTLSGAYILKGSVAFSNLPATLTEDMVGYVYNMSEAFVTDARFVEGSGKAYEAGTNVAVSDIGTAQAPNLKFDVLASFVDVAGIENEITDLQNSITAAFDETESYTTGNIVIYDNKLYQFTSDHAAGAWDPSDAIEVTLEELIDEAEPESLTAEQIADLEALL